MTSKLGAVIATAIEDDVVERGWPVGELLGSEADLLQRYGASRAVLREAIRIVEHAGVARMRRGPGGGLFVTEPDRQSVATAASVWFSYAGVARAEMLDAYTPLRSSDLAANPATTLFAEALELLLRPERTRVGSNGNGSLSERLATTMWQDIERDGWRVGQVVGSEPELLDRYGASRVAFREAVRLLEHHKAVRMRRGPGGGLFVTAPDASSVVRAAELVLAFSRVTTRDLLQARNTLEVAAVRLAAERCDDTAAAALRTALADEHAATGRTLRAAFHEVHRTLARVSGSRPISLFVDVLTDLTERDPATHRMYRREQVEQVKGSVRHAHQSIVDAVVSGDAALAERRMLRHLSGLLGE